MRNILKYFIIYISTLSLEIMEQENLHISAPKFYQRHEVFTEILSGAFAGLFNVISGYPFDVVKTRIQKFPTEYKTISQSARLIF